MSLKVAFLPGGEDGQQFQFFVADTYTDLPIGDFELGDSAYVIDTEQQYVIKTGATGKAWVKMKAAVALDNALGVIGW